MVQAGSADGVVTPDKLRASNRLVCPSRPAYVSVVSSTLNVPSSTHFAPVVVTR